jgi:hypothetical protein
MRDWQAGGDTLCVALPNRGCIVEAVFSAQV